MVINIQIAGFALEVNLLGNELQRALNVEWKTPWADGGLHTGFDRSKSAKVCVVCAKLSRNCKCDKETRVLVTPALLGHTLMSMDHEMYHHMTETVCGEEDDE
jgi:hypothetical protein